MNPGGGNRSPGPQHHEHPTTDYEIPYEEAWAFTRKLVFRRRLLSRVPDRGVRPRAEDKLSYDPGRISPEKL